MRGQFASRASCKPKCTAMAVLLSGTVLAASPALADTTPPPTAPAADSGEIVVTAQKREQNIENVPISIQALNAKKLEEHDVTSFDDYAKLLPSVSYQSYGPGQSQIYFRGVSSGADANGSHSGPQPTSALYVDEVPLTTIGGAPDLHIYDMERVEALSGPQGTLFGSSSLSGTLRLITNKPNPNKFEAGIDLTGTTFGRGANSSGGTIDGFINIPLSNNIAFRANAFYERDGGFVSNVPGTRTYQVLNEAGNTVPYTVNNAAFVKKNFNDTETAGGRAALGIDLDDNWTVTPSVIYQHQKTHGTYLFDPAVGDLQVQDYAPDHGSDEWYQAAMTIHGKISNWELTYAGGYFERTTDFTQDYSAYTVAYDAENPAYVTFFNQNGTNLDPTQTYTGIDHYSKLSNELRISSPAGQRWHVTAGLFQERQTDAIHADYIIPGLSGSLYVPGVSYEPSVPGCGDDVFCTRVYRVDRDYAGFIDASYDILDKLTIDAGVRYFITRNSLAGFSGLAGSTSPSCQPNTCLLFNNTTKQTGETHKVNLSYKIRRDAMVYFTYSTGFRPGGINRIVGVAPYTSDTLDNFEIGAKSQFFDRKLTLNFAAFLENWHGVQFGLAPPGQVGVLATYNAGNARIKGLEGDFNLRVAPFTLSGSASYIDAKLVTPFCNFNSSGNPDCVNGLAAPAGTPLPTQPRFKGNITARYEFPVARVNAYVQATVNHQSGTRAYLTNGSNGLPLLPNTAGFSTVDFAVGGRLGTYTFEAFVQNAFDERGILSINTVCVPSICGNFARDYPIKPQEFGVKIGTKF